jgi:hypothetical protein
VDAYLASGESIPIEEWAEMKCSSSPTFLFWLQVLNLEELLLAFVRSLRQGDYQLFKECLKQMIPWFYLFDHIHYARWLSVHIKDLQELPEKCPEVDHQFNLGNFVVRKTRNPFSALAIDQAHEQHNAEIKGSGGAIGLLQDPAALHRWSVAGPEVSRLIAEFLDDADSGEVCHHEQYEAYQTKFTSKTKVLKESFEHFGNPFLNSSEYLITLDSGVMLEEDRAKTLQTANSKGVELFESFVRERLEEGSTKSVFASMKKNNIKIFAKDKKCNSSEAKPLNALKNDVRLFSRLFIACQNRKMDLDNFFQYENQTYPPCFSLNGEMRTCTKSDLVPILEQLAQCHIFSGTCDVAVYDGSALANIISPRKSRIFKEYAEEFITAVRQDAVSIGASRKDLVFDLYSKGGLKNAIQIKRGVGLRRQVVNTNHLPKNWPDFLRNSQNKEDLFELLGRHAASDSGFASLVSHVRNSFVCSPNTRTSLVSSFSSELAEADGRIILHAYDGVLHGAKIIVIRTVDTDVLVLAISFFFALAGLGLQELWIHFGVGNRRRYIAAHKVAENLGEQKSVALRAFHAFTGCDTVSSFSLIGKTRAWNGWLKFDEVTEAFAYIALPQNNLNAKVFELLERYVVLLYDNECVGLSLSQTRKVLFTSKSRSLEHMPPTFAALQQHILRAAFQSGHLWGQALKSNPVVPNVQEWGWCKNQQGELVPNWSNLPPVSDVCRELVKCGCRSGCSFRCSCRTAGLFAAVSLQRDLLVWRILWQRGS